MSLLNRKPRPLSRDAGSFRDDRLFIIACDDTFAPKQYFDFFQLPRVQIHVITTPDGTSAAPHVLERLLATDHDPDDELWLILDVDHYGQGRHLPTFLGTIADAKKRGVNVALNKPCFELWLLLHHVEESQVVGLKNAVETEQTLRAQLGQYNKSQLRASHFPLATVAMACARGERLDASVEGGELPAGNTARVYKIWRAIAAKALPTQLPEELRSLLP